jgi:hypothetical protein
VTETLVRANSINHYGKDIPRLEHQIRIVRYKSALPD